MHVLGGMTTSTKQKQFIVMYFICSLLFNWNTLTCCRKFYWLSLLLEFPGNLVTHCTTKWVRIQRNTLR